MKETLKNGQEFIEDYEKQLAEGVKFDEAYVRKVENLRKTLEEQQRKFNEETNSVQARTLMNEWGATSVEDMRVLQRTEG